MNKLLIIILLVAILVLSGCAQTGKLTLQITDQPPELNIEKAEVTISEVQVHRAGGTVEENNTNVTVEAGWFTVVEEAQTFDLIAIKDIKEFLGSTQLTPGKYTQIRLSIDEAKVTIDGTEHDLEVPSEKLKLNHNFDIAAGQETVLTLDFDAQESIHAAGKDEYQLRPTIRVIQE